VGISSDQPVGAEQAAGGDVPIFTDPTSSVEALDLEASPIQNFVASAPLPDELLEHIVVRSLKDPEKLSSYERETLQSSVDAPAYIRILIRYCGSQDETFALSAVRRLTELHESKEVWKGQAMDLLVDRFASGSAFSEDMEHIELRCGAIEYLTSFADVDVECRGALLSALRDDLSSRTSEVDGPEWDYDPEPRKVYSSGTRISCALIESMAFVIPFDPEAFDLVLEALTVAQGEEWKSREEDRIQRDGEISSVLRVIQQARMDSKATRVQLLRITTDLGAFETTRYNASHMLNDIPFSYREDEV